MKMQPVDLLYRFGESPAIVDYRASWRTFKPKLKKKKKNPCKKISYISENETFPAPRLRRFLYFGKVCITNLYAFNKLIKAVTIFLYIIIVLIIHDWDLKVLHH